MDRRDRDCLILGVEQTSPQPSSGRREVIGELVEEDVHRGGSGRSAICVVAYCRVACAHSRAQFVVGSGGAWQELFIVSN